MATPLELFFAKAWKQFLDGPDWDWDAADMQEAIRESGLGEWRPATQEDLDKDHDTGNGRLEDVEVDDEILVLTDAGRAAVKSVREHTKT